MLTEDGIKGDFWCLDPATLTWSTLTEGNIKGVFPTKRHSMAFDAVSEDLIILYGGKSEGNTSTSIGLLLEYGSSSTDMTTVKTMFLHTSVHQC